jgi:DNA-binding transcriptional regulator YiaG
MTAGEIRELRKQHLKMNREQFAQTLGVAPRTVEFWEQGRGRPKRDIEERIEALKDTE